MQSGGAHEYIGTQLTSNACLGLTRRHSPSLPGARSPFLQELTAPSAKAKGRLSPIWVGTEPKKAPKKFAKPKAMSSLKALI